MKVGDALEVVTDWGLAYLQFAHDHPEHGSLIRVLPGLHPHRPTDLGVLIAGPTRFVAFYPAATAARRSWATRIGSFPIPPTDKTFPLMKWTLPKLDDTLEWLLWDGKKVTKRMKTLSEEEMDLPMVEIWSPDTLMERLSPDWSWRTATEYELAVAAAVALENVNR